MKVEKEYLFSIFVIKKLSSYLTLLETES